MLSRFGVPTGSGDDGRPADRDRAVDYLDILGESFLRLDGRPRRLLVCGLQTGNGSTTLSCLLAMAIRRYTGERVVLVDAHLQAPSVHTVCGVANTAGVGEILAGEGGVDDCLSESEMCGISVLTAGQERPVASSGLRPAALKRLFDDLDDRCDYTIVDGLPLLEYPAEALSISQTIGNLIIVLEAGRCRWETVANCRETLEGTGVDVLGVILNRVEQPIPDAIYRRL